MRALCLSVSLPFSSSRLFTPLPFVEFECVVIVFRGRNMVWHHQQMWECFVFILLSNLNNSKTCRNMSDYARKCECECECAFVFGGRMFGMSHARPSRSNRMKAVNKFTRTQYFFVPTLILYCLFLSFNPGSINGMKREKTQFRKIRRIGDKFYDKSNCLQFFALMYWQGWSTFFYQSKIFEYPLQCCKSN